MTDSELLSAMGADEKTLFNRFGGHSALAMKFIRKFVDDPNYGEMCAASERGDYREVEMTSHTIKGVAANLELKELSKLSSDVCNAVRTQDFEQLPALIRTLGEEYERIVALIRQAN